MRQSARLGDQNQEHCVVYNMIRLADYLLRFTGKAEYGDYIERNVINGLFAQGFFRARTLDACGESPYPETGIVAYYLPLMAGGQKKWGSKTEDFWCCHCTAVQANASYWEYIYYCKNGEICISQYQPSRLTTKIGNTVFQIQLCKEDDGVSCLEINDAAINGFERPSFDSYVVEIRAEQKTEAVISFRVPWWLKGEIQCSIDGEECGEKVRQGYLRLKREWTHNRIRIILPRGLHTWPLTDEEDTVAIMDGPEVLAGLIPGERILFGDKEKPETFIRPHNERVWGNWTRTYKTFDQQNGFYLKPVREIGSEKYTVYFPVRKERF